MRVFFIEWNAEYGKMMINNLSAQNDVHQISRMLHRFKSLNRMLPGKALKKIHFKVHAFFKTGKIRKNDLVVCNAYSALAIIDFIGAIPCKKALLCRDTIEKLNLNMRKKNLLTEEEEYLEKIAPYFDKIYSFDKGDCTKYNINYLPQFLSFTLEQYHSNHQQMLSYKTEKVFYVGEFSIERANILTEIHSRLNVLNCMMDFYLVSNKAEQTPPFFCKTQKLSYTENLEKTKAASILVEINRPGQTGLTLRALEALFFNKKLITNNRTIKEHEFYSSDRIFIWGEDSIETLAKFIDNSIKPVSPALIEKYMADTMLHTLIKNSTT